MTLLSDTEIDIFVATKIGSFKHIKYHTDATKNTKKCIENLLDIKSLQKDDSITCMVWNSDEQKEILFAKKNQVIQTYNTLEGFTKSYTADFGTGHVVGLGRCKRKMIAALSGGTVKIWSRKQEDLLEVGKIDRMMVCPEDNTLLATGGEENDLKVWKIGEATPTFTAKNLAHDWLQLRRPVWVTDLCFIPGEGGNLVAACSRHGYIRLYDTRAQRRPVVNVESQMAATCITPSFDDRQVLVGFGRGQLHQVELRQARLDKGYKGCAGAVTAVAAVREHRLVLSASLDRQIRVHAYDTKDLLYRQYLTSKLSCLLVQSAGSTPLRKRDGEPEIKEEEGQIEKVEAVVDEMDELFDNMETISEKPKKKKLPVEEIESKRLKPATEGSTEEEEDAIVKLLRSTEKQKRKREKMRKEKKAKSIYHNA